MVELEAAKMTMQSNRNIASIGLKPSAQICTTAWTCAVEGCKVPEARVELEAELRGTRTSGALNDRGNTYSSNHQPNMSLPYIVKPLDANP